MATKLDSRRLNDGAQALNLAPPKSLKEMQAQLEQIGDCIAAMQSLDDLGSVEANNQAMRDIHSLLATYEKLETQIKSGASK